MDGGGRVAESLTGGTLAPGALARPNDPADWRSQPRKRRPPLFLRMRLLAGFRGLWSPASGARPAVGALRRTGVATSAALLLIAVALLPAFMVRGGHQSSVDGWLKEGRHVAANAVGFRIASVAIAGHKHLSRDEVLAIAGIDGRTSLLFLDAAEARAKLAASPWVGDATVQKLYPDRLAITVNEREAFALWQRDSQINVIAADGTVLEAFVSRSVMRLPFVVGVGADTRAKDFLHLLTRHPEIAGRVRASVLIGERRWNLKLKNGVDVRLPESGIAAALKRLAVLQRDKALLDRDIRSVDLRAQGRVTVGLSESAARARDEMLKTKRTKLQGGDA